MPDSSPIPQKPEISKTSLLCIRNTFFREREKTHPGTFNSPVVKVLPGDLGDSNSNILSAREGSEFHSPGAVLDLGSFGPDGHIPAKSCGLMSHGENVSSRNSQFIVEVATSTEKPHAL